jgi:hypothetical protein
MTGNRTESDSWRREHGNEQEKGGRRESPPLARTNLTRDWRLLARVSFVGFLFYITAVKKERLRFIEGKMNG